MCTQVKNAVTTEQSDHIKPWKVMLAKAGRCVLTSWQQTAPVLTYLCAASVGDPLLDLMCLCCRDTGWDNFLNAKVGCPYRTQWLYCRWRRLRQVKLIVNPMLEPMSASDGNCCRLSKGVLVGQGGGVGRRNQSRIRVRNCQTPLAIGVVS